MNARDRQALGDLKRRRTIVEGLMQKTRANIEELVGELEGNTNADPADIARLQVLVFHGKVLVQVLERISEESTRLAARVNAPTIKPDEMIVPDNMPWKL